MKWRWPRHTMGDLIFRIAMLVVVVVAVIVHGLMHWGDPDPRAVVGMIRDTGGHPVAGAEVWADPGGFRGWSGPDGSFEVSLLPYTQALLHALPDAASGTRLQTERVSVRAGQTKVVLTVPVGGSIRFRLDPAPRAPGEVWAELRTAAGVSLRYGRFDSSGTLSLASLPPGPLTLEVKDESTGATALLPGLHPASQEVLVLLSSP